MKSGMIHVVPVFAVMFLWSFTILSEYNWNKDEFEGRPMSYMPLGPSKPRRVP
jgi:hypothetical protein